MKTEIKFCNWDYRPAVLVGEKAEEAWAVLRPGGPWVAVDRDDVWYTASVLPEPYWRKLFLIEKFGHLDVSRWRAGQDRLGQDNVPQDKPLPMAKDFDDAAKAICAYHWEQLARQAHKIALNVLAAPATPPIPHIAAPSIAP